MDWSEAPTKLRNDPESRRVFLVQDRAPRMGEIFINRDLAKALRLIADAGPRAYYTGDIAKAILATEHELSGTMSADDLREFSAEWVDPISTTYRGWKVYELPPNVQGVAALEMLNIMEQSQPAKSGPLSAHEIHKRVEVVRTLPASDRQRRLELEAELDSLVWRAFGLLEEVAG